jgi:hypothetical protein
MRPKKIGLLATVSCLNNLQGLLASVLVFKSEIDKHNKIRYHIFTSFLTFREIIKKWENFTCPPPFTCEF